MKIYKNVPSSQPSEIDAAVVLSQVEFTNFVFVAKNGADANDGKRPDEAKLTIQAAVTAAASGDTVFVFPGSYDEAITLKNGVDIVAFNPEATKILRQVTDNNVECVCNLRITIESASGKGLYIRHASSIIVFDGDISSSDNSALYYHNGIVTINGNLSSVSSCCVGGYGTSVIIINGNISSSNGCGVTHEGGSLTVNGSINTSLSVSISLIAGTLTIKNNSIICNYNNAIGHGCEIDGGTLILQNVKILCTHADAKSIYAATAQNCRCMNVWANRNDDANITQLIASGFNFDADVQ